MAKLSKREKEMRLTLLVMLLGGLHFAAACGGDDDKNSTTTNTTRATTAPAGGASGVQQIGVILKEYSIVPEKTSTQAGKITFNIENKGPSKAHEMLVFKTDTPLDKLP